MKYGQNPNMDIKRRKKTMTKLEALEKARSAPRKRIPYRTIIKEKCLDCAGNQVKEVKLCKVTSCSLHRIRPFKSKEDSIVRSS